jgi:hypothetical protein
LFQFKVAFLPDGLLYSFESFELQCNFFHFSTKAVKRNLYNKSLVALRRTRGRPTSWTWRKKSAQSGNLLGAFSFYFIYDGKIYSSLSFHYDLRDASGQKKEKGERKALKLLP